MLVFHKILGMYYTCVIPYLIIMSARFDKLDDEGITYNKAG